MKKYVATTQRYKGTKVQCRALRTLLFLIKILILSIGGGRCKEQFASVRIRDIASIGSLQRVVASLITVDDDLGADRKRFPCDTAAEQGVRAAAFDHPDVLG